MSIVAPRRGPGVRRPSAVPLGPRGSVPPHPTGLCAYAQIECVGGDRQFDALAGHGCSQGARTSQLHGNKLQEMARNLLVWWIFGFPYTLAAQPRVCHY